MEEAVEKHRSLLFRIVVEIVVKVKIAIKRK